MIRHFFIIFLAAVTGTAVRAQDVSHALASIEQTNLQLRAAREAGAANIADLEAANTIWGPTSLEYSPFFHRGVRGLASSELIVTQEFEVPTLLRDRRQGIDRQLDVNDAEYRLLRRDILLSAAKLCYDLDYARQNAVLVAQRLAVADSLLAVYERRLALGHATLIDVGRIRMDRMTLTTEAAECQSDIVRITESLEALNGGQPLPLDSLTTPAISMSTPIATPEESLDTRAALAALSASQHEVKMSRKSWYPTFTVGFRRNTDIDVANGGFVVGVSFPLSGGGKKQRAARLHESAAELQLASAQCESTSRERSLRAEAMSLQRTLATYDAPLMQQQLEFLMRAVMAGELTISDYYTEATAIYAILQQRLTTENSLAKVLADLHRDSL